MKTFATLSALAALAGIAAPALAQDGYSPPPIGTPVLPAGQGSILGPSFRYPPGWQIERVRLDAGTAIARCAIAMSAQAGNQVTAIKKVRYSRNGLRVFGALNSDQNFRCNVNDFGQVTNLRITPDRAAYRPG